MERRRTRAHAHTAGVRDLFQVVSERYVQNPENAELGELRTWLGHVGFRSRALDVDIDPRGLRWNVFVTERDDFDWENGQITLLIEEQANLDRLHELLT